MADDDAPDKEPQDDAANPEAAGGPPPLAGDGADHSASSDGSSAADAMEKSLPEGLKGGEGTVGLGLGSLPEKEEKTFAMLAHILGIAVLIGPLVIWALKKDESPFVDDQGRESIAFQLLMLIAFVVVGVIGAIPVVGCAAVVLWPAVGVTNIIMVVMAGLKANEGVAYRYPFALRVL